MMATEIPLTQDMIWMLGLLFLTMGLFVSEYLTVDCTALLILVLIGMISAIPSLPTLLPVEYLFTGFSSNAVISIIAIMIIGSGLDRTGCLNQLATYISRLGSKSESNLIAVLCLTVSAISSFMQNIGAAALFLPVAGHIAKISKIPLSRILMPMGFCAILGGTMTMIGSSPLILLNDLIAIANQGQDSELEPIRTFSLFSVTPIGLLLVVAGILYFVIFGRYVLSSSKTATDTPATTKEYFQYLFGIEGGIYHYQISRQSPLNGKEIKTIKAGGRDGWIVALKRGGKTILAPTGSELMSAGCVLAVMGKQSAVAEFAKNNRLQLVKGSVFGRVLAAENTGIGEIVVPIKSGAIGKSIGQLRLRHSFGITVLVVYRIKEIIDSDIAEHVLQAGDTLVIHGNWQQIASLLAEDFIPVTHIPRVNNRVEKFTPAICCLATSLSLILFTEVRLSLALMVGALGMLLTGVLKIQEAYQAVNWQSVFLLACLIPLGMAMEHTSTAFWLAQQILTYFSDVPIWVLQLTIAIITTLFTLLMSNVGATVLLVPLAISIANGVNADPALFALTVALASSNSFLIPTHQVNALLMGPGGYMVRDYLKAGGGMTLLFLFVLMLGMQTMT